MERQAMTTKQLVRDGGISMQRPSGTTRSVILASADVALRQRLRSSLSGMRWTVREAGGGAEAAAQMEESRPEALLMDTWLPDLEASAFAEHVRAQFPGVDLLNVDGGSVDGNVRSPRRHELLHALREAQVHDAFLTANEEAASGHSANDGAAWASAPVAVPVAAARGLRAEVSGGVLTISEGSVSFGAGSSAEELALPRVETPVAHAIAEMVGTAPAMLELARLIRLVAPRSATVLIEGETGTGKEVVAKAVHRLSARAAKPFVVLNCAAIPEALLEAELFGHTRGAFTGAVQSRTGRIEAAHGGTLFLDEIGEMPLALQAKMLRFLECGELQKVGENETMRVDVRVIAATHQLLEKRASEGTFRLDLYHRLAVFPVEVPPLRERTGDIAALAEFFLAEMGKESPRKRLSTAAYERLMEYAWPGNVRELAHVLERATILAGDAAVIATEDVRLRARG